MAIDVKALEEKVKAAAAKIQKKSAEGTGMPKGYDLTELEGGRKKVMIYGPSGSGKTFFLVAALEAGERVLVRSTDLGGNGLTTVVEELKKRGRKDLFPNLKGVDLSTYKQVLSSFEGLETSVPALADGWTPTVDVWDGFSTFQVDLVDEEVLSYESTYGEVSELREQGLVSLQTDWQAIKRGTMRPLRKFLSQSYNGAVPHKIVTMLEGKDKLNELTNKVEKSVLLQGSARDLANVAFDLVLQTFVKTEKLDKDDEKKEKTTFWYRSLGDSSKYSVKSRGIELPSLFEADPARVWKAVTGGVE